MLNINNTLDGFLKDVEIKGNTIQDAENLADIRSVGDKVEGQELYKIPVLITGKKLFDVEIVFESNVSTYVSQSVKLKAGVPYVLSKKQKGISIRTAVFYSDGSRALDDYLYANDVFTPIKDDTYTFRFSRNSSYLDQEGVYNMQLEEGSVATEYEPYQEDKLTILSPVQLEKVGDVADRIICKDGVWGVEKNIKTYILNNSTYFSSATQYDMDNTRYYYSSVGIIDVPKTTVSTGVLPSYGSGFSYNGILNVDTPGVAIGTQGNIRLRLDKSISLADFMLNEYIFKYQIQTPQFIPLPHDQQVKLRTFAGQTNIHFETEIEGTIKASAPKSMGATVNTHTEQIDNLNKELDRVKKLEESTVSTVATESSFTTVEETSNGYFEDVKLEGRTLVNRYLFGNLSISSNNDEIRVFVPNKISNGVYTLVNYTNKVIMLEITDNNNGHFIKNVSIDSNSIKAITLSENEGFNIIKGIQNHGWDANSEADKEAIKKQLILEGDHTQNPPSYFEGLISVGQDVEEVSVESEYGDGNLIDETKLTLNTMVAINGNLTASEKSNLSDYIKVKNGDVFTVPSGLNSSSVGVALYDKNKNYIKSIPLRTPVDTTCTFTVDNDGYMRVALWTTQPMMLFKGDKLKEYQPYQSNKKPLLYYNPTTETWEKLVLREWDSMEKHSDGKYYYHKRSEELILNGNQSLNVYKYGENEEYNCFSLPANGIIANSYDIICDKFNISSVLNSNSNCIYSHANNSLYIKINSKIISASSEDSNTVKVEKIRTWLQVNPTTVVYQLAQEEVYECTNIDLITYANETNYIVESGAIVPKTTLKVHSNISNVVKLLQEKVSLLESNVKASQEVQDMMILESDLRILDIELALMEHMPITLNLGENTMLRSATYFNFIKNHIVNETYSKDYLENVMNKYLATNRLTQEEYDELYKLLYPPVYDIALPIEE